MIRLIPPRRARQCRALPLAAALLAWMPGPTGAQDAAAAGGIASLNMCTDQLLLDLVPRARIVGLSPYARDADRSWAAAKAEGLPLLSGGAEEIMVLRPSLVVGGRFGARATRAFLKARGVRVAEFDFARSIADVRGQLRAFGALTGTGDAAAERIAAIDSALERLRAVAAQRPLRVLPLARRGWVSGQETLMSDLLAQAGLVNAAGELGLGQGGFVALEAVIRLRPDAILIATDTVVPEDQGSALLEHPALTRLFPPERRIHLPERLTVCGGAMLAEAMDHLAREIGRLSLRRDAPRAD
jgi:iron complex transport system substrate-binding protein